MNSRYAIAVAAFVLACALSGCSNLSVRKVPMRDRIAGTDCQDGFRYYLNRPYLVVKNPIAIYEKKVLVTVGDQMLMDFLHGTGLSINDLVVVLPGEQPRPATEKDLEAVSQSGAPALDGKPVQFVIKKPNGGTEPVDINTLKRLYEKVQVATGGATPLTGAAQTAPGSTGDTSPSGTASTGSADTTSLTLPTIKAPDDTTLQGDIAVIYLPDMDEQYAIRSKNCLAKTAFGLAFKNGTELAEVQGEHDSTTLAISLLQQVQKAIGAAQGIAQQELQQSSQASKAPKSTTAGGAAQSMTAEAQMNHKPVYQMTEKVFIRPGVYRLNKPWEMGPCGTGVAVGIGLLTKLGLPTAVEVQFEQVNTLVE